MKSLRLRRATTNTFLEGGTFKYWLALHKAMESVRRFHQNQDSHISHLMESERAFRWDGIHLSLMKIVG